MATLGTFTAGQVLTAAELNAIGTWTTYTPTFTNMPPLETALWRLLTRRSTNWCTSMARFTLGSTSSVGNNPIFTLPVARHDTTANELIGTGVLGDAGTAELTWLCHSVLLTNTDVLPIPR
jgi:hypothetical protein